MLRELEYEAIKDEILGEFGFTIDQIIELQGLSIASAITKTYPNTTHSKSTKVLICCGTETIGKSGLVAARHLKLFVSSFMNLSNYNILYLIMHIGSVKLAPSQTLSLSLGCHPLSLS